MLLGLGALATSVAAQGEVVARLETMSPEFDTFILRGTVPVPKGTFPRADGKMPFSVVDSTGAVVPAQVEMVSRYPRGVDGADVVEVLARVQRPAVAAWGDFIRYDVVATPSAYAPVNAPPNVQTLTQPGQVILSAKDVFGNLYTADLMRGKDGRKSLRDGRWAEQVRNYEVMRPTTLNIGPPSGALDHLFGVHAYVTTYTGKPFVSLDLRVNNGPAGGDKQTTLDDPMGSIYFDGLDLELPKGWVAVSDWRDPGLGVPAVQGQVATYPLITSLGDGTMHVLFPQQQFQRRIVLCPAAQVVEARSLLREEWLGFCKRGTNGAGKELWSWWNPATARFFPQNHTLPKLDHIPLQTMLSRQSYMLDRASTALVTGTTDGLLILGPWLGWAMPWGVYYGGMTGGTEIYLYDGVMTADSASNDGYRLAQLQLRMYVDRHDVALYEKNGEPTDVDDWVITTPTLSYVPMSFYTKLIPGGAGDPFGFVNAPVFQTDYVESANKKPWYESALAKYKAIDAQHQIRFTRNAKVLTWLGNDALAKDELMMQAAVVRLSYHPYYISGSGQTLGNSMLVDQLTVDEAKGRGLAFGRGEGWSVDTMVAAYAVADSAWRVRVQPWFRQVADIVRDGQSACSGFIQRITSNKMLKGKYQVRASIEQAIVENAIVGLRETVFRDADPGRYQSLSNVMRDSAYAMITVPGWSVEDSGPFAHVAVAPTSSKLLFCNRMPRDGVSQGAVDKAMTFCTLAYGYEVTQDPVFLQRAMEMSGGSDLLKSLESTQHKNLENRAALLALAQALAGG